MYMLIVRSFSNKLTPQNIVFIRITESCCSSANYVYYKILFFAHFCHDSSLLLTFQHVTLQFMGWTWQNQYSLWALWRILYVWWSLSHTERTKDRIVEGNIRLILPFWKWQNSWQCKGKSSSLVKKFRGVKDLLEDTTDFSLWVQTALAVIVNTTFSSSEIGILWVSQTCWHVTAPCCCTRCSCFVKNALLLTYLPEEPQEDGHSWCCISH